MSTKSPEVVAIRLERVPMTERLVSLLYVGTFGLMMTVLWAMAQTRSMESQTRYYSPLAPELVKAASAASEE